MTIRKLAPFVREELKGKNLAVAGTCSLPLLGEAFFRLAEATVFSVWLYLAGKKPVSLFLADDRLLLGAALALTALRIVFTAPLYYAASVRLTELCAERPLSPVGELLSSARSFRRSLALALWRRLIGLAALAPAAFFGITAFRLASRGGGEGELFLTIHACALTLVSALWWISLRAGLSAAGFVAARYPERSALSAIALALRLTRGKRLVPAKLCALYAPMFVSIAGAPFAVSRVAAGWATCVSICAEEEEYAAVRSSESGGGLKNGVF